MFGYQGNYLMELKKVHTVGFTILQMGIPIQL
jgi:hypothetical protein